MPRSPLLLFLPLALLMLSACPAAAADTRPVDLPLASGKVVRGVVESADEREVVLRLGPDQVRRIPWAQLLPAGVYRVRAALAPPADGEARLELAELAVELGLYSDARVEFEKALALGALTEKAFLAVVSRAEHDAVEAGVKRALTAADAGDWEGALQTARELKLHFGRAPNAAQIDRLIGELLKRVKVLEKEMAEAQRELDQARLEADRNKEILRRRLLASDFVRKGTAESEKAATYRERGNVTRARKHADAADASYTKARRHLGRLRRILPLEHPEHAMVLGLLDELDKVHFDLLFQTAWFFWESTVFSRADEYAARASYIDPVHPDLLELRDQLRRGRIRYRFSDVTNARPIVR